MDSKDNSPSDRHGADLALMRLGHEMRRRIRDRATFTDALRDTAARMGACSALLWMPYSRLAVHAGGIGDAVSVPVATEFEGIHSRIAAMEPGGQPTIIQGDDMRVERRAA